MAGSTPGVGSGLACLALAAALHGACITGSAAAPTPRPAGAVARPRVASPAPRTLPPRDFVRQALGNEAVTWAGTRSSMFWSERGASRAVVTRVYKDGSRARYEYQPTGSMPEHVILETETSVYFIGPRGREVLVAKRQEDPDVDGIRLDLALQNYLWRYESAAGRERRVVAAYHRETGRLACRLWVLVARKIVVRAEHYSPEGRLRSSWSIAPEFTAHLDERLFQPPRSAATVVREIELPERISPEDVGRRAGFVPVSLPQQVLPRGFELVDTFLGQTRQGRAVTFIYSDGLETLTLVEAAAPTGARRKLTTARLVRLVDRTAQVVSKPEASLVHWRDKERLYTLTGACPEPDLLRLSQELVRSVRSQEGPVVQAPAPVASAPRPRRTVAEALLRGWSRFWRWFR